MRWQRTQQILFTRPGKPVDDRRRWTGVRLRDVLDDMGIKNDAVCIRYYDADRRR